MVVMRLPSCMAARVMQDNTRRPSMWTVQAPHSPRSHPFFVPVNPTPSRNASSSVVRGSRRSCQSRPLMFMRTVVVGPVAPGIAMVEDVWRRAGLLA